jgi:hypothetical protein
MNPPNNIAIKGLLPLEALDKISIVKLIKSENNKIYFLALKRQVIEMCMCMQKISFNKFFNIFHGMNKIL